VSSTAIARLDHASVVTAAARNNAEWCDAVCRTHGLRGVFARDAWTSPRRTPPLYPDAVTLTASADPGEIVEAIDASPGVGVKDSFACLDLSAQGFDVLFEAEWIHREASAEARPSDWQLVRDAAALERWETAWAGDEGPRGLFRTELLGDANVLILGVDRNGVVAAGAILSRTEVVGVSNLFAADGDLDAAWAACLAAAAEHAPGAPLVGYEVGDDLAAAHAAGFTSIGPLRVWAR
jgi:hypothetical protein